MDLAAVVAVVAVVAGTATLALLLWRQGRRDRPGCDRCPRRDGDGCPPPPQDT